MIKMKHQLIGITVVTIIMYLFGSVCAGTLNIGEWNNIGRVILALIWLMILPNITVDDTQEKQ
jgi:putative Mn2+ efflux pump MntP